jgi:uncharacterized membrane protein
MGEINQSLLTASLTIIGAILILIITKIIEKYIEKRNLFENALLEILSLLNMYSNIYTNGLNDSEISENFRKKIKESQEKARKSWVKLHSAYYACKNKKFIKTIPEKKFEELSKFLIYLSNAPIIKYKNQELNDNIPERIEKFNKIKEFIEKNI